MGAVGAIAIEVRREPLDDVVVVDARVRHRQLVVVGVEPEQRQVRVHHLHVDAVEVHVLEDDLRVAFRHAPAGLAIPRDRPAFVSRACATSGRSRAPPSTKGSISKSSSHTARSRRCFGRRVRNRSVGSRRCPSAETTKSLSIMAITLLPVAKPTGRYNTSVRTQRSEGERRGEAVEATPGRLDVGRLGRRRRARPHQSAHAREGARRACAKSRPASASR